jgi:class 3 adenylate cyclase/tetratricopeptide (TPR) repeat protein
MTQPAAAPRRLQAPARLVGRRVSLDVLSEALDRALSGDPALVFVSGEPGIGKTRLVREAASLAEAKGAQVCVSRCIEGSVVPYLPFASALLPRLERAGLVEEGDVLQLLRPGARPVGALSTQDRTPELFFALPRAVFDLAALRPLLFVVDDVHWADESTLGALEHLALGAVDEATQRAVPLCLVLVHRDLPAASPAGRVLNRLRREHIAQSIALAGMDGLELNDLVWESAGSQPSPSLVVALRSATGGNPLFVLESLNRLAALGQLRNENGHLAAPDAMDEVSLQNEVTVSIEERVIAFDPAAADVLTAAALLGEVASVDLLHGVTGLSLQQLSASLDEGESAGFVILTADGMRFQHPLVRTAFARRLSPARRRALHLAIATALAARREPDETEVAAHMLAAGSAANPLEQGRWAARAGDRALAVSAWGEAARFLAAALNNSAYLATLGPAEQASLWYRLALAQHRDLDVAPSQASFARAVALYSEQRDLLGWADALAGWIRAHIGSDLTAAPRLVNAPEIRDFFLEAGDSHPLARARMECQVADMLFAAGSPEARDYASRALAGADATGDLPLRVHAAQSLALALWQETEPESALFYFEMARETGREYGDPWYEGWPLQRMPLALVALGRLKEAEAVAQEAATTASQSHDWADQSLTLAATTGIACLRGEFDLAEASAVDAGMMYRRSNYAWTPPTLYPALAQARLLRGEFTAAGHVASLWEAAGGRTQSWLLRLLRLAHEGKFEALQQEVDAHPERFARSFGDSMMSLGLTAMRAEIACMARLTDAAADARGPLAAALSRGVVFTLPQGVFLIPRVLGDIAAAQGDFDAACAHYEHALAAARMSRAQAEFARTSLNFARVLESHPASENRERAIVHLRDAHAVAVDLGMKPLAEAAARAASAHGLALDGAPASGKPRPDSLDAQILDGFADGLTVREIARRTLVSDRTVARRLAALRSELDIRSPEDAKRRHGEMIAPGTALSPSAPRAAAPGLRVVFVSDVVSSTLLNQQLGDSAYVELLQQYNRIVRGEVARFGGVEVKQTGDGILAWFVSAADAVSCALAAAAQFPLAHPTDDAVRVDVCAGISAGEPIAAGDDLWGLSVTEAFRICDRARPGQILVSDAVHQLVRGSDFEFIERGRAALKGFKGRMRLFEVQRTPAQPLVTR